MPGPTIRGVGRPRCPATSHGAPGRDRTCDQVLRRHLLYPLSYGRSRRRSSHHSWPGSGSITPHEVGGMDTTSAVTGSWADGNRYEAYVGRWSRPVAQRFVAEL